MTDISPTTIEQLIAQAEPIGIGAWHDDTHLGHGLRETREPLAEALVAFLEKE